MTEESRHSEPQLSCASRDDPKQRIDEWLQSWNDGTLGALEDKEPDPFLVEHFESLSKGKQLLKILVPMCGTCIDMKWFADRGHHVVGVDVSEVAARLFFRQHDITYTVSDVIQIHGKLYKSTDGSIKFYVANFFLFNKDLEGYFDVVWDTGSFGSIDIRDRNKYMSVMNGVLKVKCLYLLEILVYDREKFAGNKFSVVKVAEHDVDVPDKTTDIGEDRYV